MPANDTTNRPTVSHMFLWSVINTFSFFSIIVLILTVIDSFSDRSYQEAALEVAMTIGMFVFFIFGLDRSVKV